MSSGSKAELVFRDGPVFTAVRNAPPPRSVAVRDGKIMAVGNVQQIDELIGSKTRTIELQGRTLMPGLNEAHSGVFVGARRNLFECIAAKNIALERLLQEIGAAISGKAKNAFIVAGSWNPDLKEAIAKPGSLRKLDVISGGRPVVVTETYGNGLWVNSAVLELTGIDSSTATHHGEIGFTDGRPNGLLLGQAMELAERLIPSFTPAQNRAAALEAMRLLNAAGITSFMEGRASDGTLAAFKSLDADRKMSAWCVAAIPWDATPGARGDHYGPAVFERRSEFRGQHLFPNGIKVELDGVPHFRSAAFLQPYRHNPPGDPDFRGHLFMGLQELAALIAQMDELGVTVKMHAVGDAAVRQALDAAQIAKERRGALEVLHHIAHPCFIDPADIPRFAQIGVVAELSPMIWYPNLMVEAVAAQVGPTRSQEQWAIRALCESGAPIAVATAWPAGAEEKINPWSGLESLVTRRNPFSKSPEALNPRQSIDLRTALELMTLRSAEAMGLGHLTGSISVGKSADLILLDRDLFAVDIESVSDTRVLMTVFEGTVVHGTVEE